MIRSAAGLKRDERAALGETGSSSDVGLAEAPCCPAEMCHGEAGVDSDSYWGSDAACGGLVDICFLPTFAHFIHPPVA